MMAQSDSWSWWLETKWLPGHRWTPEEVHPLLLGLMEKRGTGFMTVEHVLAVMDGHDWVGDAGKCVWPYCRQPAYGASNNARYCRGHAEEAARRNKVKGNRAWRQRQKAVSNEEKLGSEAHQNPHE
jgi:hypothetical protein